MFDVDDVISALCSQNGFSECLQFNRRQFDYAGKKPFSDHDRILCKQTPTQDFYIAIQEARKSEVFVDLTPGKMIQTKITYLSADGKGKTNFCQSSDRQHRMLRELNEVVKTTGQITIPNDPIKAVASARSLGQKLMDGRPKVILPLVIFDNKSFDSCFVRVNDVETKDPCVVGILRRDDRTTANANYGYPTYDSSNTTIKYKII